MGTRGASVGESKNFMGKGSQGGEGESQRDPACVLDSIFIGKFGAPSRCWLANHQALNLHIVDEKPTTPSFCPIGTVLATAQIDSSCPFNFIHRTVLFPHLTPPFTIPQAWLTNMTGEVFNWYPGMNNR